MIAVLFALLAATGVAGTGGDFSTATEPVLDETGSAITELRTLVSSMDPGQKRDLRALQLADLLEQRATRRHRLTAGDADVKESLALRDGVRRRIGTEDFAKATLGNFLLRLATGEEMDALGLLGELERKSKDPEIVASAYFSLAVHYTSSWRGGRPNEARYRLACEYYEKAASDPTFSDADIAADRAVTCRDQLTNGKGTWWQP